MRRQLILPVILGMAIMLSLAIIPAHAFSHDKTLIILFKDSNGNKVPNAECEIKTNSYSFYTLTNNRGMASASVSADNHTISVECINYIAGKAECNVFLKRETNVQVLIDTSDATKSSCT